MSDKNQIFRDQYKIHPDRIRAISRFESASNKFNKKEVRKYMYQFMATLGLELESRFPDDVSFNSDSFILFGREKSEKSINQKKQHNIEEFDKKFLESLESGNTNNTPLEVRPIFDLFAFKLVCPESKEPEKIIDIVLADILNDIKGHSPEHSSYIDILLEDTRTYRDTIIDFIDSRFSNNYPELKNKILLILHEQSNAESIQQFLDDIPTDVSSLTYSQYSSIITTCYQKLIRLSYEESYEEYVKILQIADDEIDMFSNPLEYTENDSVIDNDDLEEYRQKLEELLDAISKKKTNKLDLSVGDLMVFDILNTSQAIKNLGVTYSKDPSRSKHKRNPNGYIAEFYSLDMPFGLTAEIQLQSQYRYTYGESGPAAHSKMKGGEKKRTLIALPKDKLKYKQWAEKQFKALPKYFKYLGHGIIQVYNTLQNFKRYYDSENQEQVQAYVKFIAERDVEQLTPAIKQFSLDDAFDFDISTLNIDDKENDNR